MSPRLGTPDLESRIWWPPLLPSLSTNHLFARLSFNRTKPNFGIFAGEFFVQQVHGILSIFLHQKYSSACENWSRDYDVACTFAMVWWTGCNHVCRAAFFDHYPTPIRSCLKTFTFWLNLTSLHKLTRILL